MKVSELLTRARALIEDERSWTQGAEWRDAQGGEIDPWAWQRLANDGGPQPNPPCQFSAAGAVRWVSLEAREQEPGSTRVTYFQALMMLNKMARRMTNEHGRVNIAHYNDASGHADVLMAFGFAIATARIDEQMREQVKQSREGNRENRGRRQPPGCLCHRSEPGNQQGG